MGKKSVSGAKAVKVYRPPGLTLAIIAAVVLFSGWSLVKFYIAWRLNAGIEKDGILFGSTLPFDLLTQINGFLGALVVLTAIFAWRGKPPQARFVFQGVVLLSVVGLIVETILRSTSTTGSDGLVVINSGENIVKSFSQCQIPLQIMVTLYIIWQLQQEETTS